MLIVSPHFPPDNAPDYHRVRLALPHLSSLGWEAEVLAVDPDGRERERDLMLARALPTGLPVHRVKAWPARWTRLVGLGDLALRSHRQLRQKGDELLATGRFDLVFFSTTQFGVLDLGPRWQRRWGIPYVIDFQDEWISSYYGERKQVIPPGGRAKFAFAQWRARRKEAAVLRGAAQILSVSARYNTGMAARHGKISAAKFHVLPFGGTAEDFAFLDQEEVRQNSFDPHDGCLHWVYVGRGGQDLIFAATAFFQAVQAALNHGKLKAEKLRLHFIGTSYAPRKLARATFLPLAAAHGLDGIVSEQTDRLPYFTALRCLRDANAMLLLGSDDPGYTPSKIMSCVLAGRPLLAVLHAESSSAHLLSGIENVNLITFDSAGSLPEISGRIFEPWMENLGHTKEVRLSPDCRAAHSAATMTGHLGRIFDRAVGASR